MKCKETKTGVRFQWLSYTNTPHFISLWKRPGYFRIGRLVIQWGKQDMWEMSKKDYARMVDGNYSCWEPSDDSIIRSSNNNW